MGFLSGLFGGGGGDGGATRAAQIQADAAREAARVQAEAAKRAAELQRQNTLDSIQAQKEAEARAVERVSPYMQAGQGALASQQALIGLGGQDAQKAALEGLRGGQEYSYLMGSASNAINQNAAATGGLRGGNTQSALAQMGEGVMANLIGQQFSRLGTLADRGYAASALGANTATATGSGMANSLLQGGQLEGQYLNRVGEVTGQGLLQAGAAQAGGILAAEKYKADRRGGIGSLIGAGVGALAGGIPGAMLGSSVGGQTLRYF